MLLQNISGRSVGDRASTAAEDLSLPRSSQTGRNSALVPFMLNWGWGEQVPSLSEMTLCHQRKGMGVASIGHDGLIPEV